MNRVTLRFKDPAEEQSFQAFDPDGRLAPIRATLMFLAIFGTLESSAWIIFSEHTLLPGRAALLTIYALLFGVIKLTYRPAILKYADRIASVVAPIILLLLSLHVATCPVQYRAVTAGVYFIMLVTNAVLPYSHLQKHLMVVATFLTCALVARDADPFTHKIVLLHLVFAGGVTSMISYVMERERRRQFTLQTALELERQRSEDLLLNTIPASVAARLKQKGPEEVLVDRFDEAVVVFADLVGFTQMAGSMPAEDVVRFLNGLFSRLDVVASQHGLEKIKTIGDAYMVVAGVPVAHPEALEAAAEAALDILSAVKRYGYLVGRPLEIRIGLHAGPVVAGVIGRNKFLYDLWGDTVNIASRLESTAEPGCVQVTAQIGARLSARFKTTPRGMVRLKGIGDVETCYVEPAAIGKLAAA